MACKSCAKGSRNITHIVFHWQTEALGSEETCQCLAVVGKMGLFANKSQSSYCQHAFGLGLTKRISFLHKLLSERERDNHRLLYVKMIPPKGGNDLMLSSFRLVMS